jgi:hypothetical protein
VLHVFRNNSPYTVIILFIFTLLIKLPVLLHPSLPVILPDGPVYNSIVRGIGTILGKSSFAWTLLTIVLLFAQGIYLTSITVRRRLFHKTYYTPAFAYITLTSIFPAFNFFSPPLLANWLILFAMDIFLRLSQPMHPQKHIFNAGFLLALAALIQFSAIGYILLFITALIILRPFNSAEWVVAVLGCLTPIYFFAGVLFLFDKLGQMRSWPSIGISFPRQLPNPLYFIGTVIGGLILLSTSIYVLNDSHQKMAISVRRGWSTVVAWLGVALVICIFTPDHIQAAWLALMLPLALFTALPLNLEKDRLFSNFIFYFLIALTLFCQFTFHK